MAGGIREAGRAAIDDLAFLAGGGEMGKRIRAFDWTATSLGPPAQWPQSLKTSIRIMLMSRQPVWIGWGQELLYFYNDPYFSIIGGKHPWALGRPTREVWQEIWPVIGPMLATAMSGDEGTYVESQLLIMERNGYPEETYYTFSYSPIPDDAGQPGGIFCANSDDTQRVIGQRELALLRDLASETARSETAALACQRSMKALGGDAWDLPFAAIYRPDRAGGPPILQATHGIPAGHPLAPCTLEPEGGPYALADLTEAPRPRTVPIDEGADVPSGAWPIPPRQIVILPLLPGGEASAGGLLMVGASPYRLVEGQYEGFLGLVAGQIAAAISDAEAAERERRRIETMAELDRAKTAFFTNVSHEFRTPLTLMLGPLQDVLAHDLGMIPPAVERELVTVQRNGIRLQKLVNTLLDFSRLEAGRVRAEFRPTDLGSFTADLAGAFRSVVERAGLEWVVDCPPLPEGRWAYIDRDLWEKVVLNLLSNAFKHTFSGSISVSVREEGDRVRFDVADTGVGIPADEIPNLFERFRRLEGTWARTLEGSGIGLALVLEVVRLHGGEISVKSEMDGPERGTTFTIHIPFGSAHLPPAQVRAAEGTWSSRPSEVLLGESLHWLPAADDRSIAEDLTEGVTALPTRTAGARVVLADDNADMRGYLSRLLSRNYRVEAVEDGRAALEAIHREMPDLVITDVMMPRLDGFALVEAIRADERTELLPIIMLSARAGEEARIEGLDAGADDYLVKPFTGRELLSRVDSAVALSRLREEARHRVEDLNADLERRVVARTAELRHANEQLEGFTHSVAHDLRQQIRSIGMNATIVLEEADDQIRPETKMRLTRLVRASRQLGLLVDDLLRYAKLGRATVSREQVDLSEIARDIADHFGSIDPCPPDAKFEIAKTPPVQGDRAMLRMVLENLIGNACKYARRDVVTRIEFFFDGSRYVLRDNGIGFDMAFANKVFEPFERLHNNDDFGGTGIGLANVRRIIEKHGGSVGVEAETGRGATFWFTLPG